MINDKHHHSDLNLAEMLNDASIDRGMAIDTGWKVIAWNQTNERISGIKKSDALGKHIMEIFPQLSSDEEMVSAFEHAMQGRKTYLPAKGKLFNRNHYENHFMPLQDDEGHVLGVMNIMHDVAHRIKAERQLQHLNAEFKDK